MTVSPQAPGSLPRPAFPVPGPSRAGLLGKLVAAVRPEFRVEIYLPATDDPVLGVRECAVPGCDRAFWMLGLCSAHARRWRLRGQPDMSGFLADPGPALHGRSEPGGCLVSGCHYGSASHGICSRHRGRWERAGRPDPAAWAATVEAVPADIAETMPQCRLPFCSLWTENARNIFCRTHTTRWHQLGSPPPEEFILDAQLRGRARIDFRPLPSLNRLELQYAVQCRHDERAKLTPPAVVNWAVRRVVEAGVESVLDYSPSQWRGAGKRWSDSFLGFLLNAREAVETLQEGTGWEVEYPRDVWRLDHIGGLTPNPSNLHPRNRLRFDRIEQLWLRQLAKRWIRLRLTSGMTVGTCVSSVRALTQFSVFFSTAGRDVSALADVDRTVLERFLAWQASQPGSASSHQHQIGTLQAFFQAIRQHRWDDTLPTTAVFFAGDGPPRPPLMPRHLAEHVMAQVEQPTNLDRWTHPDCRLVTVILIRCGLRASDACLLPFDCLVHDGHGAPYLRYRNHKMRREAAVPIDEDLQTQIHLQQQRVLARWPAGSPHLFPAQTANAGGAKAMTYHAYRGLLGRWLTDCDIRDEHHQPVHLTPHQWRHTFATRLINQDVPQEVVRVLLDHESSQMTSHYARLTDQTVRRRWEAATKVNIHGEHVVIDPDGPLAQAQWARTRYELATQALPHGYCGLPVQKNCPHANACLTCPVFLTGPEFLPELCEHRGRTHTLIETAQARGQTRVVEMNTQILTNLDRMIGEVEQTRERAGDAS